MWPIGKDLPISISFYRGYYLLGPSLWAPGLGIHTAAKSTQFNCLCISVYERVLLTPDFMKGIPFRHLPLLSKKIVLTKASNHLHVTKSNFHFHSSSYLMFPWQINTDDHIFPPGTISSFAFSQTLSHSGILVLAMLLPLWLVLRLLQRPGPPQAFLSLIPPQSTLSTDSSHVP